MKQSGGRYLNLEHVKQIDVVTSQELKRDNAEGLNVGSQSATITAVLGDGTAVLLVDVPYSEDIGAALAPHLERMESALNGTLKLWDLSR